MVSLVCRPRRVRPETEIATVTSPPYYRHRDYHVAGQIGQERSLTEYLSRIGQVLQELLRVTDDVGSCFLVVGDTYAQGRLLLVPHRIGIIASDIGWTVRNDIIWRKASPTPENPGNRWRLSHEHVLFLTKRPRGYRFTSDVLRVPYAEETLRRWGAGQAYGGRKSKNRRNARDSRMRDGRVFALNPKGCIPTDVWSFGAANTSAAHYAAFPSHIVTSLIDACSSEDDLVLDPFAGSGTTCVVAAKLGRRCLGIELNPEYVEMARAALTEIFSGAA
ncbi:MAG: DNA-methyltransferase [Isosphaeraceae bacterium]